MKKYTVSALVAAGLLAGGLSVSSASAADLGGNCCADLEERIAELEATTARKGNRKVSLTVSGWVGQQVMWWDDGFESNTYVGDLGATLGTNVKFTGQATISPGWSAGYVIHVEFINNDSLLQDQFYEDQSAGDPRSWSRIIPLQSFWFIKSDTLGKVSVGRQSQASDNTAILVDGSGSLVPANWVAFDYNSFFIRTSTGALHARWGSVGGCIGGGAIGDCNGLTQNVVRYDSPTFGGFSVSASWGEDDMWDVAARYAGEFAGFKVAVAGAYNEISGCTIVDCTDDTNEYWQVGAYVQHVPSGLFVYGAYGLNEFENVDGEGEVWYIKAGLRQRWTPLGHTVLYGEYEQADDTLPSAGVNDDRFELWGVGIVQEIDNAAMSVWVKYRTLSFEDASATDYEDFDYVSVGGLINF